MKKFTSVLMIFWALTLFTVSTAFAQSNGELQLGLSRDFGYGGFGNDIQGLFSMKIKNPPATIVRVEFFIDDTSIGDDIEAPFALQFNTDSYELGVHNLRAIGFTADEQEITSNIIQVQFVAAGAGTNMVFKIVLPIVGLILVMGLLAVFLPLVLSKGKLSSLPLGAQRNYGIGGGAVCPKCGRPFPLRLWWLNLGLSKIDRCPYCGKWSFVRPRSLSELRTAEAAELSQSQSDTQIIGESEADKLKKGLDDSRYQNP